MKSVLGVIGAGYISAFHFRALEEMQATVRIIADPNRAHAQPYVDRFGAEYAESADEVVDRPDVTAVIVLAPSPKHYEICKAALQAGKHVICEKTLTLSAAQSLELGRLAEDKGLLLFTSYMKRFFPAVMKARELMGRLGHVTSVYCRTYQPVGVDMHTGKIPEAFRPGPDGVSPIVHMSGGGILVCGGSHVIDLMLHLVGKPARVYGRRFMRPGCDVDFMFHALMDLPDGGEVHLEGNWHPLTKIGYESRGWDEGFEISGTRGRLRLQTPVWNQPENNAARLRFYDNDERRWTDYELEIVHPFVEAEKHFLARIEAGEQGEMDRYVGYRTDQVIESLWESAGSGQPVDIDWQA